MKESVIISAISRFSCRDNGVETFLKEKACEFDKRNVSRTYLFVTDDDTDMSVLAYFTVAVKPLKLNDVLPNRMIRRINGFSTKVGTIGVVIIGQLGKDVNIGLDISSEEIINNAVKCAYAVDEIAGCRVVFLECAHNDKIIAFYERNGFVRLKNNEQTGLLQMIRFL